MAWQKQRPWWKASDMAHQYPIYLILIVYISLVGCERRVPKLLEQNRYEEAYSVAAKRLASLVDTKRKKRSKRRQRQINEYQSAYFKVQNAALLRTSGILENHEGDRWPELHKIYQILLQRSIRMIRLEPDTLAAGGHVDLLPATLEAKLEDARRSAGSYYLYLLSARLPAARQGDKVAARIAFGHLQLALDYLPGREAALTPLQDSLTDIGTLRIYLSAANSEHAEVINARLQQQDTWVQEWVEIHTTLPRERIDLEAELIFKDYDVSGPNQAVTSSCYSEEVLDHIEKKKRKVRVDDSTEVTKSIEVEHYKTVTATVTTTRQEKDLHAYGNLTVYPTNKNTVIWQDEIMGRERWSNDYEDCSGDRRALPSFSCSGVWCSPPRDETMLEDALEALADRAYDRMIDEYN